MFSISHSRAARITSVFAGLAFASAASAQLLVWPRTSTTQDELVVEARTPWACASIASDGVQFLPEGIIRISFDDGSRLLCTSPSPCPLLVNLGRLPAGLYTVELVPDRPSFAVPISTQLVVYESRLPSDSGYRALRRRLPVDCL